MATSPFPPGVSVTTTGTGGGTAMNPVIFVTFKDDPYVAGEVVYLENAGRMFFVTGTSLVVDVVGVTCAAYTCQDAMTGDFVEISQPSFNVITHDFLTRSRPSPAAPFTTVTFKDPFEAEEPEQLLSAPDLEVGDKVLRYDEEGLPELISVVAELGSLPDGSRIVTCKPSESVTYVYYETDKGRWESDDGYSIMPFRTPQAARHVAAILMLREWHTQAGDVRLTLHQKFLMEALHTATSAELIQMSGAYGELVEVFIAAHGSEEYAKYMGFDHDRIRKESPLT